MTDDDAADVNAEMYLLGIGGDPIHPEGIWQCNGCGRTYPEYINGCVNDHGYPRSVCLIVPS